MRAIQLAWSCYNVLVLRHIIQWVYQPCEKMKDVRARRKWTLAENTQARQVTAVAYVQVL